jgi:hypothetical protein
MSGYSCWLDAAPHRNNLPKQGVSAMEFFTAFYIEYTVRDMDIQSYILLPSYEACQVFIRDNEDMDQYMYADGSVDKWCIKTDKLSQSIRPVLRPE